MTRRRYNAKHARPSPFVKVDEYQLSPRVRLKRGDLVRVRRLGVCKFLAHVSNEDGYEWIDVAEHCSLAKPNARAQGGTRSIQPSAILRRVHQL